MGPIYIGCDQVNRLRGQQPYHLICVFIIGVGRFGNMYKGYIDGWAQGNPVAIKRLKSGSQQGVHEFETEIEMSP